MQSGDMLQTCCIFTYHTLLHMYDVNRAPRIQLFSSYPCVEPALIYADPWDWCQGALRQNNKCGRIIFVPLCYICCIAVHDFCIWYYTSFFSLGPFLWDNEWKMWLGKWRASSTGELAMPSLTCTALYWSASAIVQFLDLGRVLPASVKCCEVAYEYN